MECIKEKLFRASTEATFSIISLKIWCQYFCNISYGSMKEIICCVYVVKIEMV